MTTQLHVDDTDVIGPVISVRSPWELGRLDGFNTRETSPNLDYSPAERNEYFRGYVQGTVDLQRAS